MGVGPGPGGGGGCASSICNSGRRTRGGSNCRVSIPRKMHRGRNGGAPRDSLIKTTETSLREIMGGAEMRSRDI